MQFSMNGIASSSTQKVSYFTLPVFSISGSSKRLLFPLGEVCAERYDDGSLRPFVRANRIRQKLADERFFPVSKAPPRCLVQLLTEPLENNTNENQSSTRLEGDAKVYFADFLDLNPETPTNPVLLLRAVLEGSDNFPILGPDFWEKCTDLPPHRWPGYFYHRAASVYEVRDLLRSFVYTRYNGALAGREQVVENHDGWHAFFDVPNEPYHANQDRSLYGEVLKWLCLHCSSAGPGLGQIFANDWLNSGMFGEQVCSNSSDVDLQRAAHLFRVFIKLLVSTTPSAPVVALYLDVIRLVNSEVAVTLSHRPHWETFCASLRELVRACVDKAGSTLARPAATNWPEIKRACCVLDLDLQNEPVSMAALHMKTAGEALEILGAEGREKDAFLWQQMQRIRCLESKLAETGNLEEVGEGMEGG